MSSEPKNPWRTKAPNRAPRHPRAEGGQRRPGPKLTLDNCPPVLRVDQAAEVLSVDVKTVRRAIHRGELRAGVTGRVIRIHRAALEAWLRVGA